MGATAARKLAHDPRPRAQRARDRAAVRRAGPRPAPPLTTTKPLEAVHAVIRAKVPAMMVDRPLAPDIAAVRALIDDGSLLAAARAAGAAA